MEKERQSYLSKGMQTDWHKFLTDWLEWEGNTHPENTCLHP